MTKNLRRYYGSGHLHFITFSCYRRMPMLASVRAKNEFVRILDQVRKRYGFALVGYVVMPEHVHLLIGEPPQKTPSVVLQVLKQRASRQLRRKPRSAGQLILPFVDRTKEMRLFWERRFHDFNVWSREKKIEKLKYMHRNPVKRGLVRDVKDWPWSSYSFYAGEEAVLLRIDTTE